MRLVLGTAVIAAVTFGPAFGPAGALAQAVEPQAPVAPPAASGDPAAPVPRPVLPPRGATPRMDSAPTVRGADCSSRHTPDIGV
jgi:hypothetical protein